MTVSLNEIRNAFHQLKDGSKREKIASWATNVLLNDKMVYDPVSEQKCIHDALLFLATIDTISHHNFVVSDQAIDQFINENNLYGNEKVLIDLYTIKEMFEKLIADTCSREDIASHAFGLMTLNDNHFLIYQNLDEKDKIWNALLYLCGVNLKVDENNYLHSIDEFADYLSQLKAS